MEFTNTLIRIFERDLDRMSNEIKLYSDEKKIWVIGGDIKNTAGNLCLHLCGNLQYYIGTLMGQTGYVRNRDLEFSEKFRTRQQLLEEIARTRTSVTASLQKFDSSQMDALYPEETLGYPMTYTFFMVHLAAHFSYHLGQINYHRRLLG